MAGQFLTHLERERYEQVPSFISTGDLNHYFYLSPEDIRLIKEQRGSEQRIGFACQLCLIRFMGFLTDNWQSSMPQVVLEHLSIQLETIPADLKNYSTRRNTRADHLQSILKYLHFTRWAPMDAVQLESWLLERALEHDKPTLLLDLACEKLIQNRILRPAIGTLERMVVAVRGQAYLETYSRLTGILNKEVKSKIDTLLIIEEGNNFTRFNWLKEYPNANTPSTINNGLNKYHFLINIGVKEWDLSLLNPNRRKFLAQKARRSTNQELQRMNDEKRYPLMLAFLSQNLTDVTDFILDMFASYIENVHHKCRRALEEYQQKTISAKDKTMSTLTMVAAMVADETIPAEKVRNHIFASISKKDLIDAISTTQEILKPTRNNFLSFIDNHYNRLRQFSSNLLKTLTFHSAIKNDAFIYAIEVVLSLQTGKLKKVPEDAPVGFVTPTWARFVFDESGKIIKHSYEWCVLFNLKDKLSSGDIYVSNSRRYADLEEYLISKEQWNISKEEVCKQLYVSSDPIKHIKDKVNWKNCSL